MRVAAFERNVRMDARSLEGTVEDLARREGRPEYQQALAREIAQRYRTFPSERARRRHDRDDAGGKEHPGAQWLADRMHAEADLYLAFLDEPQNRHRAVFDELHLDVRMHAPVSREEIRQHALQNLWRGANPKDTDASAAQRSRALAEGVDPDERVAAASEHVVARGVRRTRRLERSNSRTPSSASRSRICRDNAGCVTCSRAAAPEKLSASAIATNERS